MKFYMRIYMYMIRAVPSSFEHAVPSAIALHVIIFGIYMYMHSSVLAWIFTFFYSGSMVDGLSQITPRESIIIFFFL